MSIKRYRNRKKYNLNEEVREVLRMVNDIPRKKTGKELGERLQKHVEQHSELVLKMHGRNFQPCCYFLLNNFLKDFTQETRDFIFSIKIEGHLFPPPDYVEYEMGSLGKQWILMSNYHPSYNTGNICFSAVNRYSNLLYCQKLLYQIADFNKKIKKDGIALDPLRGFVTQLDFTFSVQPGKGNSFKPLIPEIMQTIFESDTTRFKKCLICQKIFWMERSGGIFCGDNCRQQNYQSRQKIKVLESELAQSFKKREKLQKGLRPENKLISDCEFEIKKLQKKLQKLKDKLNEE